MNRHDELVQLLAECPADALGWAGIAYHLGLIDSDAYRRGYEQAEADMAAEWHKVYVQVQAMSSQPTYAELRRRRGEAA